MDTRWLCMDRWMIILILTCLMESSSGVINWTIPCFETQLLVIHKNHAFRTPPSKTLRKRNVTRRPCQTHFRKMNTRFFRCFRPREIIALCSWISTPPFNHSYFRNRFSPPPKYHCDYPWKYSMSQLSWLPF